MRKVIQSRDERARLMDHIADTYASDEARVIKVAARDEFISVPDPAVLAHLRERQAHYRMLAKKLRFHLNNPEMSEVTVYVH